MGLAGQRSLWRLPSPPGLSWELHYESWRLHLALAVCPLGATAWDRIAPQN